MKKKIAALLAVLSLLVGPVFASADHSTEGLEASQATTIAAPVMATSASVEQMETMIKLLMQLLDLLKHQAEHADVDHHDDAANDDHDDKTCLNDDNSGHGACGDDEMEDEEDEDDHDEDDEDNDHDEDEDEDDEDHH
jgi:hypothetical protein